MHGLTNRGYSKVVDADLSGYFDTIPHQELMRSIARRASDGAMLALIKAWLEIAAEEDERRMKTILKSLLYLLPVVVPHSAEADVQKQGNP